MVDVSKTIEAKSDQLNADDLMGGAITVKISKVTEGDAAERPIRVNYEGDNKKPWYPCKSMRRLLVALWGRNGEGYVGKSITLFRDPKVMYAGVEVGGIRVSHMEGIDKAQKIALTERRGSKKLYKVEPLKAAPKPDPELKKQGDEAASQGIEAYKNWIGGLTDEQKEPLKQYHTQWTKTAKEVVNNDDDGWE